MSAYSDLVLASVPRLYLTMEEASGLPQDSSGNALHCTIATGTTTYGLTGIPGDPTRTAISFNGAQNFTIPNSALADVADTFSIEGWFKRNSSTAASHPFMARTTGSYTARLSTDHKVHLLKTATSDISGSTTTVTDTTTWHHFVCTKDGASVVTISIDGVEGHSAPTAAVITDIDGLLFIGADGVDFSNLVLAHLALYPTVLSGATILAHYVAGSAVSGGAFQ